MSKLVRPFARLLPVLALALLVVSPALAAPAADASTDADLERFLHSLEAPVEAPTEAPEALPQTWDPQTCEEWCECEQDDCYLNRCGQFGSSSCYDACDIQYWDCLENC